MTYLYRSEPSISHYKYLSFHKIVLKHNHTTTIVNTSRDLELVD